MKVLIDIPDWKYKSICEGVEACKRCGAVGIDPDIHEAIYNGTPLPKEHGDMLAERENAKAYSKAQVDGEERLKYYDSQQIGEILVKAYNRGLLAICGGMFDEKDVDECYIALMIAFKLLKTNLLKMRNIEAE